MIDLLLIEKAVSNHLEYKFMIDDKENWMQIENDTNSYIPVNYGYYFVLYQNTYFSEVYNEMHNVSLVIYSGGTAVAIWPLSIYKEEENGEYKISSWGGEQIFPPILRENGNTTETKRKLYRKCKEFLNELCYLLNIERYYVKETLLQDGIGTFMQLLLEDGAAMHHLVAECFVDLSLSEEEILKRIRRTNRYSILKSMDLYKTVLVDSNNSRGEIDIYFDKFESLHIEVAKRRTRSHATWEKQKEALINSNDFIVLLFDCDDTLVGASLFCTTTSACTYSVAVYKRELFDKPLAHISQWNAIKHMKQLGMKWYYIGPRAYLQDWNNPTDKEMSIGHFKEGFATEIYLSIYYEVRSNYGENDRRVL